jgi:hypothetical protein
MHCCGQHRRQLAIRLRGSCNRKPKKSAGRRNNRGSVGNVYFFSDETGQHSGGKYFVVAGVAFAKYRNWIAEEVQHAERASGKGKQDWKGTKNVAIRADYLNRILEIGNLNGTVFYAAYENHQKEYWDYTVDAIGMAIRRFAPDAHSIIRHQGFNYRTREKLKAELTTSGTSFEIQTGADKRCEIRLADALSAFIGIVKYSGSDSANHYPDVPDWFVDLKNEAPIQGTPVGASQSPGIE